MPEGNEGYQPSDEEIKEAEAHMNTDDFRASADREYQHGLEFSPSDRLNASFAEQLETVAPGREWKLIDREEYDDGGISHQNHGAKETFRSKDGTEVFISGWIPGSQGSGADMVIKIGGKEQVSVDNMNDLTVMVERPES